MICSGTPKVYCDIAKLVIQGCKTTEKLLDAAVLPAPLTGPQRGSAVILEGLHLTNEERNLVPTVARLLRVKKSHKNVTKCP